MKVIVDEIEYDVDFKYKHGSDTTYSPMYGADGGDAPEVEIDHVYLGLEEITKNISPDLQEKIEIYILENYIPDNEDYEP